MVAVGFNPRTWSGMQTLRRVATPECFQSSLRDERVTECLGPWVKTHGYHQGVATRRVADFGPLADLENQQAPENRR